MRTRIAPAVVGAALATALVASSARATESAFLDASAPFSLQSSYDSKAPSKAAADEYGPHEKDWEFTLAGNGSNDKDFDNGSGGLSASIGYFLSEWFELGLRQSFSLSDFNDESDWIASTRVAIDFHFDLDCVRPFVGVNLGYVYGDAVKETFEAAPEAGVKVFVKPETIIFLLGEYQFFFYQADEADSAFEDGQFVYTLGIGFLF